MLLTNLNIESCSTAVLIRLGGMIRVVIDPHSTHKCSPMEFKVSAYTGSLVRESQCAVKVVSTGPGATMLLSQTRNQSGDSDTSSVPTTMLRSFLQTSASVLIQLPYTYPDPTRTVRMYSECAFKPPENSCVPAMPLTRRSRKNSSCCAGVPCRVIHEG